MEVLNKRVEELELELYALRHEVRRHTICCQLMITILAVLGIVSRMAGA